MANQRHTTDSHVEEFYAPDPSIPAGHDSIELTEDAVVIYDREDSQQWIWTDTAVQRTEYR
jgi:hypothetical protein